MGSAPHRILLVCTMLMAIAVANAASGKVASSVVVGLAKCADCTRKNMRAEAAFKGLKVAIKCKDSNGEYTSKAVGELQSSGAFSVPLHVDLNGTDCLAQLHSAEGTPCPGQEPSRITPLANGTFAAIPGNMQQPSALCASVTICPILKPFFDHFHKKPVPPKPKPQPPTNGGSSTPSPPGGSQTPVIHHHHFFDHFHKKPVPPQPKPEPKPQPESHPTPTPSPVSPTPN